MTFPEDDGSEEATITSRADFAQWAIERAKAIIAAEGSDLAIAARDGKEDEIAVTANALGQAITDALLEVFDGLIDQE